MTWFSTLLLIYITAGLISCRTAYPNKQVEGKNFPLVKGKALNGKVWQLPNELQGKKAILLIGYVQDSQFDIDRWLIGLDFHKVKINIFEVPTINNFFAQIFQDSIDSGMRSGIPEGLWKIVITVYEEAETIEAFLGNKVPRNARVLLLDENSRVLFSHDRGFSVGALNKLLKKIGAL